MRALNIVIWEGCSRLRRSRAQRLYFAFWIVAFVSTVSLAQEVSPTVGGGGVAGDGTLSVTPSSPGINELLFGSPFGFMMIALLLLWVIVILPQQRAAKKQQAEMTAALKSLKKNDRVVTIAGIHGTIVNAASDSPTVTIRIDDSTNAKMTLNREAISRVVKEETKAD